MTRSACSACAAVLLLALAACAPSLQSARPDTSPKLVVIIAIDQLRADRMDRTLPGGLGRLAREGLVFDRATLAHGITETCPGHAALATGRHPGPAGVSGNESLDPQTGRAVYCVADDTEKSRVLDDEIGRSPRRLRASALGDWVKSARSGARVFSIAGKDRSAITMGGAEPDSVLWFSRKTAGFTSSRYYMESLPDWVADFNRRLADHVPATWEHGAVGSSARIDDYPAESPRMLRVSGHPIRAEDPAQTADRLARSPFLDLAVLDLAREWVEREALGQRSLDLLWLGLSATDTIGHLYGPESHESIDGLRRLDRALGDFLGMLEARVGRENLLVAVSADHGVLPLPEWLEETNRSTCPVSPARLPWKSILGGVVGALDAALGAPPEGARWIHLAGAQLAIDRELAAARGVAIDEAVAIVRQALANQPGIARTWTPQEIETGTDAWAALYRRSLDPERRPDLVIQLAEGCLLTPYSDGTTHGSPYDYDRRVPLVLWGGSLEAGVDSRAVATVDLAPTLAKLLKVDPTEPIDGRDLLEGR